MPQLRATVERLGAFSDGVFAVLITIMVLELKPPEQPSFAALLPLWPTALSYAVSYLFIAIVWVNHHHLLCFADYPSPRLIWINFAHLLWCHWYPSRRRGLPARVWLRFLSLCMQGFLSWWNWRTCSSNTMFWLKR
jgi:Endosomal/lysosomal potassium channel TMEM175